MIEIFNRNNEKSKSKSKNENEADKVLISFYYKHKSGGFTKRLYQAYVALANAGYHIHYFSTEILPVQHPYIYPHLIKPTVRPIKQGSALFWVYFFYQTVKQVRVFKKNYYRQREGGGHGYIVFSFFYSVLAMVAGKHKGEKQWVFIRADDLYDSRLKSLAPIRIGVHTLLEKMGMKAADYVICTNRNMMNKIAQRSGYCEKIYYLPNNIPIHLSYKMHSDAHMHCNQSTSERVWSFVTASVINPRKQQLIVLQALAQLPTRNWRYQLIGADIEHTGYEAILRDFVQQHKLTKNVEFLGWQEEVSTHIACCDLFIFPTTMEGSPNALLEALGTGIPCIGSDIPEVDEILRFPELTFSHQDVASLRKMLQAFMEDEAVRCLFAEKTGLCREAYEFNWDDRLLHFFEQNMTDTLEVQRDSSHLGNEVNKA